MYDLTAVRRRYFKVKLSNGRVIDLEPPKLKTLNRLVHVAKGGQEPEELDETFELFSRLLSKNKQHYRICAAQVEEWFDWDEMIGILTEFFGWLNQEKRDPN
ncbi:hypothetical protein RWV98_02975 [Agathobaculum sp. NTUH-O15-33]|uniref:hypothetical protein n=1 Tax=Agathobaculum sp. NTUH-O15-33 TaxID=3079302 RepID=UPI0029588A34|nr:hypothetical protein [Agathobaculum sp. NTUH-O15-33]WNX85255.1 hypothetical protein RWV98_02975 [Agathobaculum sp. NTUH-O15-33]